ncbi:hypothetical protein [Actinoallomurus sp. NPDC050550]|uniref:hypothetical protein n=1 Tax=Actinoallomurus sp. NPDC050550 TaxID=3154937 RepID=UPI0033EE9A67
MSTSHVVVVAALATAATGCSLLGGGAGDPVRATPPSVAPFASTGTPVGACSAGYEADHERSRGLVSVDARPIGVVAVWLPGMNQRPCRAALTRGNADFARRLATDIRTAPKWPSGAYNCPMDDASGASLYFEQSGTAKAELVDVHLAGCRGIGAPGRSSRELTDRLSHDLASIAPAPWRTGL